MGDSLAIILDTKLQIRSHKGMKGAGLTPSWASSHHTNMLMNHQFKKLLVAALVFISASFARAEVVTYDLGVSAERTLQTLGTDFVIGCIALAVGMVIAVLISKRK